MLIWKWLSIKALRFSVFKALNEIWLYYDKAVNKKQWISPDQTLIGTLKSETKIHEKKRPRKAKCDFARWKSPRQNDYMLKNKTMARFNPESFIPPGVLTRLRSYRLPFVSVYGVIVREKNYFDLETIQKRRPSVFQPKVSELLWERNQITSRKMGEGHR